MFIKIVFIAQMNERFCNLCGTPMPKYTQSMTYIFKYRMKIGIFVLEKRTNDYVLGFIKKPQLERVQYITGTLL